ncbi:3-isopropylmalate dehydratase small subunit [Thermococcus aggregans]|uniref:3-isopropylmalate dehydratase small subunit n=1 Tax=Thermococcus aggregans TaxID=110163 RepID=A0A9E7MXE1_THEAG|nr:3-isopropylmalate dehydratase small subunit [Thermococcus aggregans]USS40668.1 3-isopropylmalate dehydratase small subunit [Thermococcus aggregans]
MEKIIRGRAYKFGDNIDTDQIYPGRYLELTEPEEIAKHAMEDADPTFRERFVKGGIIVAGKNFGCGSSREHAAIALKAIGVSLIIAESFARIFYRNCINIGLPLLICPGITRYVQEGDILEVNLETGVVKNITRNTECKCQPLSEYAFRILEAGGIKPLIKKKLEEGGD